jgi:hypothetical protein
VPLPPPRRAPSRSRPQAQEARDSLERRVAALEALLVKPDPSGAAAAAPASAAAPAPAPRLAAPAPAALPSIEDMAEVFAAAAAADE